MRRFNPEKELSKIRNGNKKKVIISICALLVVGVLGYSFALYQVRHTQKLVFNTVSEFKKRDIYLSVLVDGETKSEFPGKDDGYVFDNIQCDKPGIKASFNNDTWELTLTTKTTNKCTVKFITKPYMDESGANYPDLFQGLIPIRYENNKIYIADYKQKWYDYNNHEWANAVLIDHDNPEVMEKFYTDGKLNVNTEITTDDILQMYVWIPRYKYQLFNVNNESKPKQLINIKFENTIETTGDITCKYINNMDGTIKEECLDQNQEPVENGDWYTHPAFTFKGTLEENGTELRGIWVGKFEPSDAEDPTGYDSSDIAEINIVPNKISLIKKNIKTMFEATRKIEEMGKFGLIPNEVDTHMMKNTEWGVVAYLSNSKYGIYNEDGESCTIEGCQVYNNNTNSGISGGMRGAVTGCSAESADEDVIYALFSCPNYEWNTINGVKASTTGNMYGVYDMSGGQWEYMMSAMVKDDGSFYVASSGFTQENPDINVKYYELYEYSTKSDTHARGHLGDATRETLVTFGNTRGGWNSDGAVLPLDSNSWFDRGGMAGWKATTGLFCFNSDSGSAQVDESFRVVLTAA